MIWCRIASSQPMVWEWIKPRVTWKKFLLSLKHCLQGVPSHTPVIGLQLICTTTHSLKTDFSLVSKSSLTQTWSWHAQHFLPMLAQKSSEPNTIPSRVNGASLDSSTPLLQIAGRFRRDSADSQKIIRCNFAVLWSFRAPFSCSENWEESVSNSVVSLSTIILICWY